jgi:hypothetical protein
MTFYYVVVGGGGGGSAGYNKGSYASGGGGGAGEVKYGTFTLSSDTTFTITVGYAGAMAPIGTAGNNGTASSLVGGAINISAIGGFGGSLPPTGTSTGGNGGNSGSGATGGAGGIVSNNGSNGTALNYSGSGGGGSGYNATLTTSGGSSVYTFAGAGSTYTFSIGGGGGLRFGTTNFNPTANTTYGSGGYGSPASGGAGIGGCVLIYYLNTQTVLPSNQPSLNINGLLSCPNSNVFTAKNSGGTDDNFLWPRWSDNALYMNYGSGGYHLRNNASVDKIAFDASDNLYLFGNKFRFVPWTQAYTTIGQCLISGGVYPTAGGSPVLKYYYSVIGNTMYVEFSYFQATGGTAGTGIYYLKFPAGYSAITAQTGYLLDPSPATWRGVPLGFHSSQIYGSANHVGSVSVDGGGTYFLLLYEMGWNGALWQANYYQLSSSNLHVSFSATVPIN